jgi:hypothetical protein
MRPFQVPAVTFTLIVLLLCPSAPAFAAPPSGTSDSTPPTTGEDEAPPPPKEPEPRPPPQGGSDVSTLTLSPTQPEYGEEVTSTTGGSPETMGALRLGGASLEFHGYMRAPMRVGIGPKNDLTDGKELHAPPRTPDASATDWRYLYTLPGPWAEIYFTYGTSRAQATVSIAGYNQTAAGYRDLEAQLGINEAFLTLTFPDALGRAGGLKLTAGSFMNRYGTAGAAGAGMYQTYLFGRTKTAGETLSADLHLAEGVTMVLEHGIGAKLDVIPFQTTDANTMYQPNYLPYPGPVPQGSTFLHHAHLGLELGKSVVVAGHYLTEWTPDDRAPLGTPSKPGRLSVYGGDVRLKGGVGGQGYFGYSRVKADHILPLADAIELLHSSGGWEFKGNYFGRFDPRTGIKPADDSGTVDSLLFEYSLSLGRLVRYPLRFMGNGPDLVATLFGMFNSVQSDTQTHQMLKYGGEVMYAPLDVLALGARADLVQPDLSDRSKSFAVVSPKVVLRTSFLAHERVQFQYSHYFLGTKAYPAFPNDRVNEADADVFMISASMWW